MGTPSLTRLSEVSSESLPPLLEGSRAVFIETRARNTFPSDSEEKAFEWKYFGIYATCPEWFYVAIHGGAVVGYLAGTPRTLPVHFELNSYLKAFEQPIMDGFPAHLHINLSKASRGLGIGTRMISRYIADLTTLQAKGVHIVTSSSDRNVSFYLKNHFVEIKREPHGSSQLLFMGREIKESHPADR